MPVTNTLETARRIEALGFSHQQAQGLSDLFEATSQDALRNVKDIVQAEGERTRAELRLEFREELRKQMLWFFATQVALFGALAALIKLL